MHGLSSTCLVRQHSGALLMRPHRILAVYTKLAKSSLSKLIDDAAVQLRIRNGDGMNRE